MPLPSGLSTQAALLLLYGYIPNKGAAVVAVICYILISIAVTAVTVKTKTWYMLLVTVAASFELAGWGSRLTTLSAPSASAYGGQQALIIISPLLLLIVQYITMYKLLLLPHPNPPVTAANVGGGGSTGGASSRIGVGPGRSSGDGSACSAESGSSKLSCGSDRNAGAHGSDGHPVLSKVVLVVFSVAQLVCVILQVSGAGVYADDHSHGGLYGRLLLLGGLGVQLVLYTGFIGLVLVVQCHKYFGFSSDRSFRYVFVCLLSCAALMYLRLMVRIAEFSQGYRGDVSMHEAYLYVFDFWPILGCFVLYTCMHFGWWLGPAAPALVARQAQAIKALELTTKPAALQQPGDDMLHIHCS